MGCDDLLKIVSRGANNYLHLCLTRTGLLSLSTVRLGESFRYEPCVNYQFARYKIAAYLLGRYESNTSFLY
jgi:hypothetical protein